MHGGGGTQRGFAAEPFQRKCLAGFHGYPAQSLAQAAGHAGRLDVYYLPDRIEPGGGCIDVDRAGVRSELASSSKMGSPAA